MSRRKISPTALTAGQVVTRSPKRMSGAPVFAGTRVPVKTLFDYLAAGDSLDLFLDHFPDVSHAQAVALLEQVGEELSERGR
ncbi:MAG: DUF433 domain-containing protein [Pyrinomonadaceae bacterium]|nr:DUF433 domain-containing protein [Pyrinomonadaceae bacterium]